MPGLSQDRAGTVRALIQAAPDHAVAALAAALRGENAGESLSSVKSIVVDEMNDRLVRDAVFEPIAPLFSPRPDGFEQRLFPKAALVELWRALKADQPGAVDQAASVPARRYEEDAVPPIYNQLCVMAARGLRAEQGPFAPLSRLLHACGEDVEPDLIAYLDLAPIARRAIRHASAWISRPSEEQQAAARLLFKDAAVIAEDSGPRLMEVLYAQLAEPWAILRIIAAVMLKPTDRLLASSELADFGARLLRDVDRRILEIKALDYNGGGPAGREAAVSLRTAAVIAAEFEQSLQIRRGGPWGEQVARQKQTLASTAESHLKKVGKAVGDALPMQPVRIAGALTRAEPRLDLPPDLKAVRRATTLLNFFLGIRALAAQSGYGVARARVGEDVAHNLGSYLDELLHMLHSGETEHPAHGRQFLEVAADFTALVHDEQSAQIIRRRAAAA